MDKEIKNKLKEYKDQLLAEKKMRATLLNKDTDFGLLESFIQKANENPNLRVELHLRDGTTVYIKTVSSVDKIDPYLGE